LETNVFYQLGTIRGPFPLYEIMHLTGHKSFRMVQRYAHLAPDFQERAIAALNAYGTASAQSA